MDGTCPCEVGSDLHVLGFLTVEGILAFGVGVALRGAAQERRPWSIEESDGSIQPTGRTFDDETRDALEAHMRRGTPHHGVLRQQAA